MSLTRGNVIDRAAQLLGDDSTAFRTYAATSLNNILFELWDLHDWEFKHKTGSFNTVSGTESYNLATSSTDIRSAQDVEVMYDSTNGQVITKTDLKTIRQHYPKEDTSGTPLFYAPWGATTIYLSDEPDAIITIKYLYLSKPTLPTADGNDLFTTCGLPDYMHHVVDKWLTAEMMEYYDDTRAGSRIEYVRNTLIPRAIQADMKHLESQARFKFWEEEIAPNNQTMANQLRQWWWGEN